MIERKRAIVSWQRATKRRSGWMKILSVLLFVGFWLALFHAESFAGESGQTAEVPFVPPSWASPGSPSMWRGHSRARVWRETDELLTAKGFAKFGGAFDAKGIHHEFRLLKSGEKYTIEVQPRAVSLGSGSGLFLVRVIFSPEDHLENPEWERFYINIPYSGWKEFVKALPRSRNQPSKIIAQLTREDLEMLQQDIENALQIPWLLSKKRSQIVDTFMNFYRRRKVKSSFSNGGLLFTASRDSMEAGLMGFFWRVFVTPDYIAFYSDGVFYYPRDSYRTQIERLYDEESRSKRGTDQ